MFPSTEFLSRHRSLLPLLIFSGFFATNSAASDYGSTGIIDVPSARMAGDGVLRLGTSFDGLHNSFMFTYQATPWLEGTFRYTGFNDFFHWDRNYEIKVSLWSEEYLLPQVSVGARDVVGTGVFGSEYIVASKRFNDWDFTLGIGWGRLAGGGELSNPLALVADKYAKRAEATGDVEDAGGVNTANFFRGKSVGFFGGLTYTHPTLPLRALLEHNPDDYAFNNYLGAYKPSTTLSYGIEWEPYPDLTITLSHQHGDEFGISIASRFDTKRRPKRASPPKFTSSLDLPESELPPSIDKVKWYDRQLYDVERSGLVLVSASLNKDQTQAELVVGNIDYVMWPDAIARHVALADLHLPASVQTFYFITEDGGHKTSKIMMDRPSKVQNYSKTQQMRNIRLLPAKSFFPEGHNTDFRTGKLNVSANINNRIQLFDPDDPARYQVYMDVGAEYTLNTYLAIRGRYSFDLDNNFDESSRDSDSRLPRVRSDVVRYLTEGANGLDVLMLEERRSLTDALHYRIFGGILEEMYAGIGGELLYWPHQSRVAVGASLAGVQQRDYDKGFGLRDYKVVSGFASAYLATPVYNIDSALHFGRYLAKDVGMTVEARRTFSNGWQVGVWATFTDVPAEEFGEGRFDKGFYFKIPLGGLFGSNTRSAYSTRVRPVQRDGGQRLENHSGTIFWDLRQVRYDVFTENLERLLP